MQTSDQAPFEKNDPRCFAQPLDHFARAGIPRNAIVHIGDSLLNMRGAHAAGIDFLAVTTGPTTREQFLAAGLPATDIFPDITHILANID